MAKIDATTPVTKGKWPGEPGVWSFICADMVVFALMFFSFAHDHSKDLQLFRESQTTLNQTYGLVNTIVLLVSSWFVASSVAAARKEEWKLSGGLTLGTFGCGLLFCIIKFFEYSEKLRAGYSIGTNLYFQYYFMLTGIHLLHVLIGLGVLAYMYARTQRSTHGANDIDVLETGASYWHLVDLLWIMLFALLYMAQ